MKYRCEGRHGCGEPCVVDDHQELPPEFTEAHRGYCWTTGERVQFSPIQDICVTEQEAERHLRGVEEAYSSIPAGSLALGLVIAPLRRRWDSGERSQSLYREIMGVKL